MQIHAELARLTRKNKLFSTEYVWGLYARVGSVERVGEVLGEVEEVALKAWGRMEDEAGVN